MDARLGWNCDFCNKPEITMSLAGILYCANCRYSYNETPLKEIEKKIRKWKQSLEIKEDSEKDIMDIG